MSKVFLIALSVLGIILGILFLDRAHVEAPGITLGGNLGAIQSGLVGYWTLDMREIQNGSIRDLSGSNNHGKTEGIASSTFYIKGKVRGATQYDGLDDYITMGDTSSLRLTSAVSMSVWVKTAGPNSLSDLVIAGKSGVGGAGSGYCICQIGIGGGNIIYWLVEGAAQFTTSTFTDNKWHHIAGTWDGARTRVYVDGVREADSAKVGAMDSTGFEFNIGFRPASTVFYKGAVDDVRVYNRGLAADEVRDLYRYGLSSHLKE